MNCLTWRDEALRDGTMTVADSIRRKLISAFTPSELEIEDESARHAGHVGARPEGETHFRVRIVAAAFEGLGRVERQRRIHAVLSEDLHSRVHALSLKVLSPREVAGQQ